VSSLKNRIKTAESKVLGFYSGIPIWCMELAENRMKTDPWRLECLKNIRVALEREGKELENPIDESRYIITQDQANKYALDLHRKYKSYTNYQAAMQIRSTKAMENLICNS